MESTREGHFDAVVIGSGPGGAMVSRDLSRKGARVLILERGPAKTIKGTMLQTMAMALVPGRNLLFTEEWLAVIRATVVGGSSMLAYAAAFEPPYPMFEERGVDLRQDVQAVKDELPVAPLADELVGPAARRIMECAGQLGYDWARLPKMVYQEKCRSNCDKCTMGCPYGAKWTARELIDEACELGATLLTQAAVRRLTAGNGKIDGVEYSTRGESHSVSAPLIILAAGGIGTPMILRASGITGAGTNFFFDPLVVVNGTVDDLDGGREMPMAAGLHDPEAGYVLTDIVWPWWLYAAFSAEVLRFDRITAQPKTLPIMIKIKDDLGGRLTARGGIRKRLSQADRSRLARGTKIAKKILKQAGARHIFQTWTMAVHPGGTAKIGDVVDSNLKTRFDNLYVCDCSVIPMSWGLPPTLTILGLGHRLARHLAS